jgi:signal transduction histidine kinase
MKRLNKITLRLRLTMLTALTLTAVCMLLTLTQVITYSYTEPAANFNAGVNPHLDSTPDNPLIEENHDFIYSSIVYMFIMIALGSGACYFIAGKALKPVADLSESIENIDENKLFQPLEGFDTNDEVARLAASFNRMIKKLEKSFHHQKHFSANAAHELKTPLAGIIANIEVLQLDENPTLQEYKEVLNDTLANAQRLSILVHDLLKMSNTLHIDSCESFEAKEMFDEIILALTESSKVKNVRIANHISNVLFGEKALLQRAFLNLVQNAVKYNKMNGEVVISATQNDDFVTVHIQDSGIGIPVDERESIFEPFYRVDSSRSRELGGSGLGLSIVKTIVEKHNGKIFVDSELGGFSKITIVLPKKLTVA